MLSKGVGTRGRAVIVAGLCAVMASCGVDEVDVPDLFGPSERAESLVLSALPDVLVADGTSFSVIQAIFRDQNGQPLANRAIFFRITDESGLDAAIGRLSSDKGAVFTGANGVAQVIYTTPYRTDATANQTVRIEARPVGTDFNGRSDYKFVRIELRSAEFRLFPENPLNDPPTCNFAVEAPNGYRTNTAILFQNTSSDVDGTIVRYEWRFSDTLNTEYSPDTAHVFRSSGAHTVVLTVTDDDGGQAACQVTINIS